MERDQAIAKLISYALDKELIQPEEKIWAVNALLEALELDGCTLPEEAACGEEELSQSDKQLMAFGRAFEQEFIGQGNTDRTMEQTLDLGWELLATLPRNALDRCDAATLDKYYEPAKARISKK